MIADERAKRLAGIDEAAAEVQAAVDAEQKALEERQKAAEELQRQADGETAAPPAPAPETATPDAAPLPEPRPCAAPLSGTHDVVGRIETSPPPLRHRPPSLRRTGVGWGTGGSLLGNPGG